MLTAQRPDDDVTADGWFKDHVECELTEMFNDPAECAKAVESLEDATQIDSHYALGWLLANAYNPRVVHGYLQDLREKIEDANRSRAERVVMRQIERARYE